MKCPRCDTIITEDAPVCRFCGQDLRALLMRANCQMPIIILAWKRRRCETCREQSWF